MFNDMPCIFAVGKNIYANKKFVILAFYEMLEILAIMYSPRMIATHDACEGNVNYNMDISLAYLIISSYPS